MEPAGLGLGSSLPRHQQVDEGHPRKPRTLRSNLVAGHKERPWGILYLAWGLGAREKLPQTEGIAKEMIMGGCPRRPSRSLRKGLGT